MRPCALGVSRGGYTCAQLKRPLSARSTAAAELSTRIAEIRRRSRQTYGAPRTHAELEGFGPHFEDSAPAVAKKREASLDSVLVATAVQP